MKHFEGMQVWLRPTGNNARRWKGQPVSAFVKKVARVNITLVICERQYEQVFRMLHNSHNRIDDGCNSGYVIYETLEALKQFDENVRLVKIIKQKTRDYSFGPDSVSHESLVKVVKLLGGEV